MPQAPMAIDSDLAPNAGNSPILPDQDRDAGNPCEGFAVHGFRAPDALLHRGGAWKKAPLIPQPSSLPSMCLPFVPFLGSIGPS
jgi:hypothetical protein